MLRARSKTSSTGAAISMLSSIRGMGLWLTGRSGLFGFGWDGQHDELGHAGGVEVLLREGAEFLGRDTLVVAVAGAAPVEPLGKFLRGGEHAAQPVAIGAGAFAQRREH